MTVNLRFTEKRIIKKTRKAGGEMSFYLLTYRNGEHPEAARTARSGSGKADLNAAYELRQKNLAEVEICETTVEKIQEGCYAHWMRFVVTLTAKAESVEIS